MAQKALEFLQAVSHGILGVYIGAVLFFLVWLYRSLRRLPPFTLKRELCWLGCIGTILGLGCWKMGQTPVATVTMMLVAITTAAGLHSHPGFGPKTKRKP